MKSIKTQKNSLIFRLCAFGLATYVGVSLISLQMEINSKQSELATVRQQIENERVAAKDLERQLSMGDDESYLSRIAHSKLDMSYSDEHVYRDASGT